MIIKKFTKSTKKILILMFISLGFLLFMPADKAEAAGTFGDMVIYTKVHYANKTVNLNGAKVTVRDGGSGHTYSGRCNSKTMGTRKCSTAGMVNLGTSPDTCLSSVSKTSSSGHVSWSNTFSSCKCTFKIDLSAPSVDSAVSSDYVWSGGWSPAEPYSVGSFGNDNTYTKTFTMTAVLKRYNLTVNINPAIAATSTGDGAYNIHAVATAGYKNLNAAYQAPPTWSGNCSGTANTDTVTMNGNRTCTATFALKPVPTTTPLPTVTPTITPSVTPSPSPSPTPTPSPTPPMVPCAVSLTATPADMCAVDDAGTANTSFDALSVNSTYSVIDFGDGTSNPFADGAPQSISHTYSGFGFYNAKATCIGTDNVTRETPVVTLQSRECPNCNSPAASISSNLVSGTGIQNGDGSISMIDSNPVDIDFVASITGADFADWGASIGVTKGTSGSLPRWANPLGEPLRFSKSGYSTVNLTGYKNSVQYPGNLLVCAITDKTIRIIRQACTVTEGIKSTTVLDPHPKASNIKHLSLEFTSGLAGVEPDGFSYWELLNTDTNETKVDQNVAGDTVSVSYIFSGTGESGTLKPGNYKLTLHASSMTDQSGKLDSLGDCTRSINFVVDRGPEMYCTISPSRGTAPQAINVSLTADLGYYTNIFTYRRNLTTKSVTLSGTGVITGIVNDMLEVAGKYHISVEGTKIDGTGTKDTVLCNDEVGGTCTGGGLCSYVVTNPGGGGGGEVAP